MPKYRSKLIRKENVAEGTTSFYFEKPEGFTFKAGQNVDIELLTPLETDKEGNKRTFSLVSAPSMPELQIVTRMRESAFKRSLKDLSEGSEVEIEGPYGNMTLHSDAAKPAVFLAGGIGITPLMSMVRDASERNLQHKTYLFYSNRRPEDAPFLKELKDSEKKNPHFKLIATTTNPEAVWNGERGYITKEMIQKYVSNFSEAIYYLAGPPVMVAATRRMLEQAGILDDYIKMEEFAGY